MSCVHPRARAVASRLEPVARRPSLARPCLASRRERSRDLDRGFDGEMHLAPPVGKGQVVVTTRAPVQARAIEDPLQLRVAHRESPGLTTRSVRLRPENGRDRRP